MKPTVRQIIDFAALQGGVSAADILSPVRHREIADVRHRAMWASRTLRRDMGWPRLGARFGRHHTSVIHAWRRIEALRAADVAERALTDAIVAHFNASSAREDFLTARAAGAAQFTHSFQIANGQFVDRVLVLEARHVP
jgi:hypothetical protein